MSHSDNLSIGLLLIILRTFGMWGSLLAGGEVIVPKGRNNDTLTEEDEIYLAANMPGWLYVDTRWGRRGHIFIRYQFIFKGERNSNPYN